MIHNRTRNQLLMIVLAVGFFIGIIYENMNGTMQLFRTENLRKFQETCLDEKEYFFYLLKMRMLPAVGLVFLWNFKWRKTMIAIAVGWLGYFWGKVLVSAIVSQGIKGIAVCVAVLFPHVLFYLLAYLMVLLHLLYDRKRQWNRIKTFVFVLFYLLGIWSEMYINPIILKIIFAGI